MMDLSFEGHVVRVVGEMSNPQWIARDVAEVLGIAQPTLSLRLKEMNENWLGIYEINTNAGKRDMTTVFEPGLYSLIFGSQKAQAKRFQRWVFEEVLPEIRRTGQYGAQPEEMVLAAEVQRTRNVTANALAQYQRARCMEDTEGFLNEELNKLGFRIELLKSVLRTESFVVRQVLWEAETELFVCRMAVKSAVHTWRSLLDVEE